MMEDQTSLIILILAAGLVILAVFGKLLWQLFLEFVTFFFDRHNRDRQ